MYRICLLIALLTFTLAADAQLGVSENPLSNPHPKAGLDVNFDDKGVLVPRMPQAVRDTLFSVSDPSAEGMLIYQTDNNPGFYFYDGSSWQAVGGGNTSNQWIDTANGSIYFSSGNVGIGTANPQGLLDLSSDNQAFIFPRLNSTARDTMSNPVEGMMIFNLTSECFEGYTGSTGGWRPYACNCNLQPGSISGNAITCLGDSLILNLNGSKGAIQWQQSNDGNIWFDLVGQTDSILELLPPSTATRYFRAILSQETCLDTVSAPLINQTVALPTAAFTPQNGSGAVNYPVTFTASQAGYPSYNWTFQSGSPATSSTSSENVTWSAVGTYNVSLDIVDGNGCTDSTGTTINIESIPLAGLTYWIMADAGITTSGSSVTQWDDQSGNNRDATQSTSSLQPQLVTGAVNGLPAVRFNSDRMDVPAFNTTGGMSMFFVINLASTGDVSGQHGVICSSNNFTDKMHFYLRDEANNQYAISNGGVGFRSGSVSAGAQQLSYVYTGSNETIWKDGAQVTTQAKSTNYNNADPIYLGYAVGIGSPQYLIGDICEILIYDVELTTTQRKQVENYLSNKWGTP